MVRAWAGACEPYLNFTRSRNLTVCCGTLHSARPEHLCAPADQRPQSVLQSLSRGKENSSRGLRPLLTSHRLCVTASESTATLLTQRGSKARPFGEGILRPLVFWLIPEVEGPVSAFDRLSVSAKVALQVIARLTQVPLRFTWKPSPLQPSRISLD